MSYDKGLKLGNDGLYRYRLSVDGKIYTGNTGESVEEAAKRRLLEIRADLQRGLTITKPRKGQARNGAKVEEEITFAQAVDIWCEAAKGLVSDGYINNVKGTFKKHFKDSLGPKYLYELEEHHIFDALKGSPGERIEKATYNIRLAHIRAVLKEAHKRGLVGVVKTPPKQDVPEKSRMVLSPSEISKVMKFLETYRNEHYKFVLMAGIHLGLRISEIVDARWRMINWEHKTFRNEKTKGKEAKSIPINSEMYEYLSRLYAARPEGIDANSNIITNKKGNPYIRSYFSNRLRVLGKKLIDKELTAHVLRRTFITQLNRNGVNVKVIQSLARHKDLSTTLLYVQVDAAEMASAVEALYMASSAITTSPKPPV